MNTDTILICREIANEMVDMARMIMDSHVGVNNKVGINTLKDSDLYRQIDWKVSFGDTIIIENMFNYYIQFIEDGRPPKKGKMPPEDAIIKWLRKKHIVSSNRNIKSVAYLIRRAIWRDGYNPRPILKILSDNIEIKWEEWAGKLFESMIKDIITYFKEK